MPLPIYRPIARRRLLLALGAGALAAPFGAFAQQQAKVRRIGYLAVRSRPTPSNPNIYIDAFVQEMGRLGYAEGKNLVIEINLSRTLEERLSQLVREAEAEEWLAANRKAIDAYSARVERDGVWSDKLRGF